MRGGDCSIFPASFAAWREAVGYTSPPDLALWLFQAALNLSEARTGALLVVGSRSRPFGQGTDRSR